MADGFTIKHRDDFESMEGSGNATWQLARKSLGTQAFGFNLVQIGPGGRIPEHDHAQSDEVEVYAILDGEGKFRLNGEDHPAPAGTFASIDPEVKRAIVNESDAPVSALLIGVPRESGYAPAADWL